MTFFLPQISHFQDERHVAVLGVVADVGDADTVAVIPGGSAGAGGEGDVGGKLGGHWVTVQVLVVVVAGYQCEGERCKCKNLVFIISIILLFTNQHLHHHLSLLPSR